MLRVRRMTGAEEHCEVDSRRYGCYRGPSAKFRAFLAAYVGEAKLNGVEAARMAGYANPSKAFVQLRKRRAAEIAEAELAFRDQLQMGWAEVAEGIAAVARDAMHKDRLKALELLAKIHGKLDPKLSIQFDRATLEKHIADVIAQLSSQVATDAPLAIEAAPPPALPEAASTDDSSS